MTHHHFRKSFYALALAMPLFAAGCADNGPWPMPTGYAYHQGQYKAPAGPEPVFKKWQYEHGMAGQPPSSMSTQMSETASTTTATTAMDTTMPAVSSGTWDQAAHDLVSRMIADFGRPAEAVWLQSQGAATDQSLEFEKALLAALQQAEVHLASDAGGGPFTLQYSVMPGSDASHVQLSIALMSAGHRAASESGSYAVGSGGTSADSMSGMPPAAGGPDMSPMGAATTTTSTSTSTTSSSSSGPMTALDTPAEAGKPMSLAPPHFNE